MISYVNKGKQPYTLYNNQTNIWKKKLSCEIKKKVNKNYIQYNYLFFILCVYMNHML
jgi:hypothetical protein